MNILTLIVAIEIPIILFEILFRLGLNKIVFAILVAVTVAAVTLLMLERGRKKIEHETLKLYNYIYTYLSIREDRVDYVLEGLRNWTPDKEETLEEILKHIPSID